MDPQLARLFSGLAMSAVTAKPTDVTTKSPLDEDRQTNDFASRPSSVQPRAQQVSRQTASPAPRAGATDSPSFGYTPTRNTKRPSVAPTIATPSEMETTLKAPSMHSGQVLPGVSPTSEVASIITDVSNTSSSSATTPSGASRRSSIADISPYLQRPAQVPITGRRMKQLALLESVVDESSLPQSRPASVMPGPVNVPGFGLPPGMPTHPGLSASVPPPQADWAPYGLGGPPVPNGNGLPSRSPYMPMATPAQPPLPPHYPVQNDPFQVRPRTAAAMRQPTFAPPPGPNGRSMHESQLLSILAGAPGPGSGPAAPPHMPGGLPNFGGLVPTPLGRMGPAPAPLRAMPPSALPPFGGPPVLPSAPAHSPYFPSATPHAAPFLPYGARAGPPHSPTRGVAPGSAANLLSLLNGPPTGNQTNLMSILSGTPQPQPAPI